MGMCNHDYVKAYVVILLNVVHEHVGFDGMIGLYDDLTVFPLCVASVVEGKMRAVEAHVMQMARTMRKRNSQLTRCTLPRTILRSTQGTDDDMMI